MLRLFEFKKRLRLPEIVVDDGLVVYPKSQRTVNYVVGRYIGDNFQKVVTFDSQEKAVDFMLRYRSEAKTPFVLYIFDLSVSAVKLVANCDAAAD